MLINRTCHTLIFVLTIAQFGCGTKPPSHVLSPTENFEAEWKCVDKPDRSIYIGEKRWCLFDRDPQKSWIDGKLTASKTPISTVINVNVDRIDTSHDKSNLWNGENEVTELVFVREDKLLRVVAIDKKDHILNGYYRHAGTMAPIKGPNVHEWGRLP